jgi:hypothetical protein
VIRGRELGVTVCWWPGAAAACATPPCHAFWERLTCTPPTHPPTPACLLPACLPACLPAGEEPHTGIIAGITLGNPTLVTTVEDERLEFQDGDEGRGAVVLL